MRERIKNRDEESDRHTETERGGQRGWKTNDIR